MIRHILRAIRLSEIPFTFLPQEPQRTPVNPKEAMRRDWEVIGQDMRIALNNFKQNEPRPGLAD